MRRSPAFLSSVLFLAAIACGATIPSGTKFKVRIKDDSETLARSFQFHAELVDDVSVAGKVILPRGTAFLGETSGSPDDTTAELVAIRLPKRDYPIVTSRILVGGTKAAQTNQRRQEGMQAAADAVRGAIAGTPDLSGSAATTDVGGLAPGQVLQFKLRKAVEIEDQAPPKKKDLADSGPK